MQAFIATYFSYMHIFAPHLRDRALRAIRHLRGVRGPRYIVPHTHPGTCSSSTRHMLRMCVDTDLSCGDSTTVVPVPYVVSFPLWLVQEHLPVYPRTTLLFFRGHLPKPYIDTIGVRRKVIETLKNEPNVSVVPANVKPGAKYSTHDEYLQQMLRARFCLAPRGDTASAKRLYESIAAGCIPIIISDRLKLPFERQVNDERPPSPPRRHPTRHTPAFPPPLVAGPIAHVRARTSLLATQMDWTAMSLRYSEKYVADDPHRVLRALNSMSPATYTAMHRNLLAVRHMFLWHTDDSRRSAVDYVIHDLCAWEHA